MSNMTRVNTMVWGAVVVFIATLGTIVALSLTVKDSEQLGRLIGLILPAVGALVVLILALDKVSQVDQKVDKVGRQTSDLTNGLLDAKMRVAVASIIRPEHIDPGAQQQLEADQLRVSRYTAVNDLEGPHS